MIPLRRAAPARVCRLHHLSLFRGRPLPQSHPNVLTHAQPSNDARGYGVRSSSKPNSGHGIDGAPPTDFAKLDVFRNLPQPGGSIDSCLTDGFNFSSGLAVTGSVLIIGGEVFRWFPARDEAGGPDFVVPLLNDTGLWEAEGDAFGALDVVWPKPDLLVLGTGRATEALAAATKHRLSNMGIRVEVVSTRNAAAQYNLLAVERGIHEVAAALIPAGWKAARRATNK